MRTLSLLAIVIAGCSGTPGVEPDAASTEDAASTDAGVDASPDASVDAPACTEGATRPCGSDVGACAPGVETCANGAWSSCEGAIEPAPAEICDGAIDDNCDGTVDETCPDDPFDAASCGGAPWEQADALARLGEAPREILASATIQVRTRTCPGGTCGPWSEGAPWQTRFLTWSGGSVTRYMMLQADTRLVLFRQAGAAALSIQHVTFSSTSYPDTDGIVWDVPAPGTPQPYPVFRAYNVTPENMYDYRDLELTLKHGELALGPHCARFTATVYGASEPFTTEYAALYRW